MKDMMTSENILMDHNSLRWVAQPNHNSLNNGKVETHMADHLFVGAACEESKPKLWKNKLRPSWTFSSCWGIWFWMDPGFRTKNSCFATSYPGPRLYALLVKGVVLPALTGAEEATIAQSWFLNIVFIFQAVQTTTSFYLYQVAQE